MIYKGNRDAMKKSVVVVCLFFIVTVIEANEVPIIGVLTQEAYSVEKFFPNEHYDSFIAASYVKYLESAGARVVPVWIGQDENYYKGIIEHTNGILFPGGATWFNESNGYGDAGQHLYNFALEANKNGKHYPIFGICLGMELLAQVAIQGEEIRAHCSSHKMSLPLEFKPGHNASKTFNSAPKEIIDILSTKNVTYNYHRYCLTETNFTKFGLAEDWRILATNKDEFGLEFISVYESKKYPFYGLQFHPEKTMFEFVRNYNIPHSLDSVKVSQYFANLFVEEARKNDNTYPDWLTEQKSLIYNYSPAFIGIKNSSYEQVYVFKKEDCS